MAVTSAPAPECPPREQLQGLGSPVIYDATYRTEGHTQALYCSYVVFPVSVFVSPWVTCAVAAGLSPGEGSDEYSRRHFSLRTCLVAQVMDEFGRSARQLLCAETEEVGGKKWHKQLPGRSIYFWKTHGRKNLKEGLLRSVSEEQFSLVFTAVNHM